EDLDEALNDQGISLVFAELKDPVRRKIERYGLTRTINPQHFFPTVESAIAAFRQETGADWAAAGQATTGEAGTGETGTGADRPRDVPASPPAGRGHGLPPWGPATARERCPPGCCPPRRAGDTIRKGVVPWPWDGMRIGRRRRRRPTAMVRVPRQRAKQPGRPRTVPQVEGAGPR